MISRFVLQSLSKNKLSVFLFHKVPQQPDPLVPADVSMARFEHLLDRTFSQFTVLPLEEAITRLQAGTLPRGAACITAASRMSASGAMPLPMHLSLPFLQLDGSPPVLWRG